MNDISGTVSVKGISAILRNACEIAVSGHTKPDGDCIGACLALAYGLKALNKKVYVLLEDYGVKYDCIPGRELIFQGDITSLSPDVFVACDCGSKDRLGAACELFDRADTTISLDHHATNDYFAHYNLVDSQVSSTCELVYNVIIDLTLITPEISAAICAGVLYDTGGLRHKSTTAETLMLISHLHTLKVPLSNIFNTLLFEHSTQEAKALSKAIDRMHMVEGYPIITSYLTLAELDEIGAVSKDLDGIVEYLAATKGVEVAVFLYERQEGDLKLSMRSKEIDVGSVAKRLGGGGHQLAAGCNCVGNSNEAINEALDKALELIKEAF